jgi:pimeloyl-ACP methyl ester carboxylesterase
MSEPVMKRAKGDGLEIQTAVWEGRGKQVLAVHGLTANCRCWDTIAAAVCPQHSIIAMDLRGRGLSDKPSTGYSEEHHIRDIHALMDHMGLKQVVLMGHSLGGYVSLDFAARFPERVEGVVLLDAGADLSQEQWDKVDLAIRPSIDRLGKIYPTFEAYVETIKQVPFFQPWSDALEAYFRYDLEEVEGGVRSRIHPANIREEISNKRSTGIAHIYPELSCPVLIVRALDGILTDDDILVPEEALIKMLREISQALGVDLEHTNHYTIIFRPNAKRDHSILHFLDALMKS